MEFVRLVQRLVFINIIIWALASCSSEQDKSSEMASNNLLNLFNNFNDTNQIYKKVNETLKDDVFYLDYDYYKDNTKKILIALSSKKLNNSSYGVKFSVMDIDTNSITINYQTDYLDGIKEKSEYGKISIKDFSNKLVYFNSKETFLGSIGGDIYIYIFNAQNNQYYYLISSYEDGKTTNTFSQNLEDQININLKNWLLSQATLILPDVKSSKAIIIYK